MSKRKRPSRGGFSLRGVIVPPATPGGPLRLLAGNPEAARRTLGDATDLVLANLPTPAKTEAP